MKMNEPGRQKLERQKCMAVGKARTLYSGLLDQASQRDPSVAVHPQQKGP